MLYLTNFFYVLVVSSSILMLLCSNPINALLFLILIFIGVANIFFLIGCDFLGLIFIVIYLGAIAVLFLFIVMMINIKKMEGDNTTYLIIGFLFFLIFICQVIYYLVALFNFEETANILKNLEEYQWGVDDKRDTHLKVQYFNVLGRLLYVEYFLYIMVVSMILLLGLFGAIFLTNYKNNASSKKQFNQFHRNNKLINVHIL